MNTTVTISDLYNSAPSSIEQLTKINEALNKSAIVAITDKYGNMIDVNDYFCTISKYNREELIGKNHNILNSGVHPRSFFKHLWATILKGETWEGEICNRAKDGSLYWVKTTIVPFLNEQGQPEQFISIRVDITAQKNYEKITHMMYHDELTGLQNRRKLLKDLENLVQLNKPFTLYFLDVNRFKIINEQLGHEIGDAYLQKIAHTFNQLYPNHFYRLHSDEFVVVCEHLSTEQTIHNQTRRIFQQFEEKQCIEGFEFYSSVAVGVSQHPKDGDNAIDVLKFADSAMLEAKKMKGNYYCIYEPTDTISFKQPLYFEAKLRQAIQERAFTIYYQPKFNVQTNKFDGMEALIRWSDHELGFVSPMEFIPFAEEHGFIDQIDRFVIEEVTTHLQNWRERYGLQIKVSINISAIHLANPYFINNLTTHFTNGHVHPSQIELEITETAILELNDELLAKLHTLRSLGFQIAIDDFGTGFSCLSYLQKLPINTLKIDRFFITQIAKSQEGKKMVSSLLSLGHALNLNIVAEGVETEIEYFFLKGYNCDYIQGYYFSKPQPLQNINKLIETNCF